MSGRVNGTPQPGKVPRKKVNTGGGKGGGGCAPALVTLALIGGGWLSMILTSAGWTA